MTNPFAPKANVTMPTTDRVGGFVIPESNVYTAKVKAMYMLPTKAGGISVKIVANLADGEHTFVTYPITVVKDSSKNPVLDSKGNPTQTSTYKDREGKDVYLPDYLLVSSLVQLITGTTLDQLTPINLVVKEWDNGSQQDTKVKGWSEVQGKEILMAVQRTIKNKVKMVNGKFITTDETRQVLKLDKVMDVTTKLTLNEKLAGVTEPEFHDAWIKSHAGKDVVEKPQGKVVPTGNAPAESAEAPPVVFS